jgi:gluconolactonase
MTESSDSPQFLTLQPAFQRILGEDPAVRLLCDVSNSGQNLFHEACIYHQSSKSVFVTSNQLDDRSSHNEATNGKTVKLFRVYDDDESSSGPSRYEEVKFPSIDHAMLNGGVNAGAANPDMLLFCAQGSRATDALSGIISLTFGAQTQASELPTVAPIVPDFHGIPFNSVNDVIVHPVDGSIWFTDPPYGFHQGIRQAPQLPNQVYRFEPKSKSVRAIADGFVRPNGLCFSPDLTTLYVTDTGAIHGSSDVAIDPQGASHIYAFDIISSPKTGAPILANRRLFAFAPGRFPDGIKCDTEGNVYAGCGDGIEVWDPEGLLIGIIKIPGGVANFCFGKMGAVYACNETRFWKIQLNGSVVRGALLGI